MTAPIHTLSKRGRFGRLALKRFLYSQMLLMNAAKVAFGREDPLVHFIVENEPPSLYMNFRIPDDKAEAFHRHVKLPPGLPLAKLQPLPGDDPFYCLTANIYRVGGLAKGIRLEWSTYIDNGDGKPRYCVVDARSELFSVDPIEIITKKGICEYERVGLRHYGRCEADKGMLEFDFTLTGDESTTLPTHEWVEANDLIYWTNGIADRVYYDAGFYNTPMIVVDLDPTTLKDGTEWSAWVDPTPVNSVLCTASIDIAISPWINLDGLRA